jgi:ankyrin repeat protein
MAVLQIERIMTERTPSKIRKALQTLPSKLEANYQDTVERIQKQAEPDNEYGVRILQWVSASQQPLSVKQLSLALSIEWNDDEELPHSIDPENELDPDSIVDVCGGLVIIEPASQEVRLVHFTVQEFFSKNPSVLPDAHHEICKTCLLYLSLDDVSKELEDSFDFIWEETCEAFHVPQITMRILGFRQRMAKGRIIKRLETHFPLLLEYAARLYLFHAQKATFEPSLRKLFTLFFKSQRRMVAVYSLAHQYLELHPYLQPDDQITGLHVLATLGTPALASLYLEIYPGVDPKSLRGQTPLCFATVAKQVPMMSYLISNGADVNAQGGFDMTPLLLATRIAFIRGVELLLENGADVNLVSGKISDYKSALHFAAQGRNEHLVKLLVDGGADLELQEYYGGTPLLEAVRGSHLGILRILLHAGARADVRNKKGISALSWATPPPSWTNKNYDDMIHLLLEAGATRREGDIYSAWA